MVYTTDFYTTRRPYGTTRPVVSSYSVSYPIMKYSTGVSRVYSTSYPIYSSYSSYKSNIHNRVVTSPVRVVTSPVRMYRSSPVRVISTPIRTFVRTPVVRTRVITSPVRIYSTPRVRVYRDVISPARIITTSPVRTLPSILNKEYDRISKRTRPTGFGYRALEDYLRSEPFTNFEEETSRIRHSTQNLLREIHTPVIRRARSATPFVCSSYEPLSPMALDAYVSRITNPGRHVAKEVHRMSHYAEPARNYVGKSHLASIRICGGKSYDVRQPKYDMDKVRNDINLLSYYSKNRGLNTRSPKSVDVPTKSKSVDAVEVIEVPVVDEN